MVAEPQVSHPQHWPTNLGNQHKPSPSLKESLSEKCGILDSSCTPEDRNRQIDMAIFCPYGDVGKSMDSTAGKVVT